jgi:peptidoglycan/LPS O-acetylase OafA/YrhL
MTASATKSAIAIPSLDGMRALSFGLVFIGHAGLEIVPAGLGVTIFFFLSGYLITTLLRLEWTSTSTIAFGKFYLRRVLRILPPFYCVLATALLLSYFSLIEHTISAPAIWAQACHYLNFFLVRNGYGSLVPGTGVYWSLAVEEHYYVVFPALFFLLQRLRMNGRMQALVFAGICGGILTWRCFLVSNGSIADRTYLASDTRVDSILFGAILAVFRNPVLDADGFGKSRAWLHAGFPLGVAVLLATLVFRNPFFRETFRYSIQGLALIPIFAAAIAHPTIWCFQILNSRALRFIGTLSYSLYLTHHVTIYAIAYRFGGLPTPIRAALSAAVALALAWILHIYVERPCAQLRKKLHG